MFVSSFVDEVPVSDMFLFLWLKCNRKDQLVCCYSITNVQGRYQRFFLFFYMSAFKETSILYRYEACVHTAVHISFRDLNIFYSPFPSQMLKRNRLVMKAFE